MKDAFGGAFIIRIMLVFFVIFIVFMTVAINWAKAFRVKSAIISILERDVPSNSDSSINSGYIKYNIANYLASAGYKYSGATKNSPLKMIQNDCSNRKKSVYHTGDATYLSGNELTSSMIYLSDDMDTSGVCIFPVGSKNKYYYKVTSYFIFNVPLFNIPLFVPISGESRTIKPDELD